MNVERCLLNTIACLGYYTRLFHSEILYYVMYDENIPRRLPSANENIEFKILLLCENGSYFCVLKLK